MPSRNLDPNYSTLGQDQHGTPDEISSAQRAGLLGEAAELESIQASRPLTPDEARYLDAVRRRIRSEPAHQNAPSVEASGSMEDMLTNLTLDDLNGTEDDEAVIAALTRDESETDNPVNSEASPTDNPVKEEPAPTSTKLSVEASAEFTKLSVEADPTDNPVKQKRSVSAFRDAKTMRELSGLFKSSDLSGVDTSLVSYLQSLFDSPSDRFTDPDRFKPWWDESWRPDLPSPARQYRKPAPWRDISDHLKVTLRHGALKTFGPVMAASLNLSADVEALARSQSYPLGWLHRRISYHLQQELERPVQFHLALEEAGFDHRLHLHMEIQASFKERRKVRKALRAAGGKWDADAEHRQFRTRLQPDIGWANYLVKDLWRVGFTRKVLPADFKPLGRESTTIRFVGSPTCSTDALDKKAENIYGELRDLSGDGAARYGNTKPSAKAATQV